MSHLCRLAPRAVLGVLVFAGMACANKPAMSSPNTANPQPLAASKDPMPGPTNPSPESTDPQSISSEEVELNDGERGVTKSGLSVRIVDQTSESGSAPNDPDISTPATSRSTIIVDLGLGRHTEQVFFIEDSPGIASRTSVDWENFTIKLVGRDLHDGRWTTRFLVLEHPGG